MVDVSSQSNKVNITVSSSGVSSNVNASGDTTMYYSNKAREWAISERLVDGKDYSSKYYAGKANESALNAQSFAQSAQDSYNNVKNSAVKALEDIEEDKTNAISEINTTKTSAINNITTAKNSAISDIDTTAKSYDNLTHRQITNCLLEVPQNIKLELNNGTLTLKAGSKVIVPYGTTDLSSTYPIGSTFLNSNNKVVDRQYINGQFFVWVELQADRRNAQTSTRTVAKNIYYNPGDALLATANALGSGTASTTSVPYTLYYNTSTNLVDMSNSSSVLDYTNTSSFPIALATSESAGITSIDQVFNGIGYIGSTMFADKGIRGLMPWGRNEDGSLNNREVITQNIITRTFPNTDNYTNAVLGLTSTSIGRLNGIHCSFDYENNYIINAGSADPWQHVIVGSFEETAGVISNLKVKLPFRAVDTNDFIGLSDEVDTKVSKNGDTITGALNVIGNLETIGTGIDLKNKNITKGEKPASASYWGIRFNASNDTTSYQNKRLAIMETSLSTSGMTMLNIGVYQNAAGSTQTSSLYLKKALDGTSYFSFPRCTTKPTSTSSASDEKVSVVIQNYLNGTSWYRVWSDGWCEQGGRVSVTCSQTSTVTFLKPFVKDDYCITKTVDGLGNVSDDANVQNRSLTGFELYGSDVGPAGNWGTKSCQWRACGYIK